MWIELAFTLPVVVYAVYRFASMKAAATTSTTGPLELLLVVYAFETALTTAVCINDVGYWTPALYSTAEKNVFRFQLFGPWFAMRKTLSTNVYCHVPKLTNGSRPHVCRHVRPPAGAFQCGQHQEDAVDEKDRPLEKNMDKMIERLRAVLHYKIYTWKRNK